MKPKKVFATELKTTRRPTSTHQLFFSLNHRVTEDTEDLYVTFGWHETKGITYA